MNVIITGATGLVGGELVRQAIASNKINHAFILTRRPIPEKLAGSDKLTVIQHDDFSTYPRETLEKLRDVDGCLWAIGGRASQFPDVETARTVSVKYTLAAANAFMSLSKQGKKFKFVFCSGKFAEWDQGKRLMFMAETRHIKGEVEKQLCDLADANAEKLEVWIVRPSGIMSADAGFMMKAIGRLYDSIDVNLLARDMIHILSEGHRDRIIESEALLAMGKK